MTDKASDDDDQYSPEETERRITDAIRRAVNTPPKRHKEMVGKAPPKKRGIGHSSSKAIRNDNTAF